MPKSPKDRRRSKTYVVERGGRFAYRRIIPERWRPVFGGKQVWFVQLKAGTLAEAERMASAHAEADQAKLDHLERVGLTAAFREQAEALQARAEHVVQLMVKASYAVPHALVDDETLRRRVSEATKATRAEMAKFHACLLAAAAAALPNMPPDVQTIIENVGGVAAALAAYKLDRDFVRLGEAADNMLSDVGDDDEAPEIELIGEPPNGLTEDDQVRWLGRRALEVRKAAERRHRLAEATAQDDATWRMERTQAQAELTALEGPLVSLGAVRKVSPPVPLQAEHLLHPDRISVEFERWIAFQKQRPESVRKSRVYLRRFIDVIGDIPVQDVKKSMVVRYVDVVASLPDSRGLLPALRKGSVQELLTWKDGADEVDLVKAPTVQKHLDCMKALFTWSCRRGDDDRINPALNVSAPKDDRRASEDVGPFTQNELRKVVDVAGVEWGRDDDRYWLMMLAIHTGARREELAQLDRKNLFQDGDHWFISIDDADGRQVKTENSIREIPLHSDLIAQGFIAYVHRRQSDGPMVRKVKAKHAGTASDTGTLLFPTMKRTNGYYGHNLGAGFSRLLREKAGITDPRRRWHSFRHNFADACRDAVPDDIRHVLMGHAESNRIAGGYGDGPRRATLAAHLEKVKPLR